MTRRLKASYARWLDRTLSHWRPVAAAAVALLVAALIALGAAGRSFLPEVNEGALTVSARLEASDRSREAVLEEIRERVSLLPGTSVTIGQPISHRIDHMLSGTRANIAVRWSSVTKGRATPHWTASARRASRRRTARKCPWRPLPPSPRIAGPIS